MPDLDSFDELNTGGATQEATKEDQERFRDQYRKSQAAIKKIFQQEDKKRKQDFTLAHIIVQFLNDPRFTRFFVLISRIVAKNVPSDILLAILSLIHKESAKAIGEKQLVIQKTEMIPQSEELFPDRVKAEINRWTENIVAVAIAEPHKTLETILDHNWNIDENIIELSAAVLQQFFEIRQLEIPPIENMRNFFHEFFPSLTSMLENQVHEQGILGGEVDEDFENE